MATKASKKKRTKPPNSGRKRKLTPENIELIKTLAVTTPVKDLAKRFGVSDMLIYNVLPRRKVEALRQASSITIARTMLSKEVKAGRIKRPTVCPCCGDEPKPMAGGKSRIIAVFNSGFKNWRDVSWRCLDCRRDENKSKRDDTLVAFTKLADELESLSIKMGKPHLAVRAKTILEELAA